MKPSPSGKGLKEIFPGQSMLACHLGDFEEILTERGPVAVGGDCVIAEKAGSCESTPNHVLLLGGEPLKRGAGTECTPEVTVGCGVNGTGMFECLRELDLVVHKARNRTHALHGMWTHLKTNSSHLHFHANRAWRVSEAAFLTAEPVARKDKLDGGWWL